MRRRSCAPVSHSSKAWRAQAPGAQRTAAMASSAPTDPLALVSVDSRHASEKEGSEETREY